MSSITDPQVRAFLTQGTRTGKRSFLSSSGHPLVTPVWFAPEGGTLVLPGELVVRVRPTNVLAVFDMTG